MHEFSPVWYLIYTRSKQEKKVAGLLSKNNINCFLPLKRERRKWKDRMKVLDEPMFPSYVFVQLSSVAQYTNSLQLEGVCHYVKFDNQIAKISDQEIENIRLLSSLEADLEVSYERLKKGMRYMIQQGPLSGLSCELIDYKGQHKLLVRVNILQRSIITDVPLECVAELMAENIMA
ncbi:UpxY family transcription antiterminator [Chitinophaga rhizophila]|uniref:UpxY family transcription antiterminator n=1 Tax=Chitinophaga rhizophila TaxID=2866212 RepID=A0ABS7GJ72_9BACT|nr:UpxY family transcription antiterminator [Chitinophaga rhizophila]MBW8687185.1 UpxY family transcription antiterminator [Chitinophaga rhizophila]